MAAAVLRMKKKKHVMSETMYNQNKVRLFCYRLVYLRLVNDPHDIQTGDGSSILCGLTLGIIEVSRNSDHCMGDLQRETQESSHI